MVELHRAVDQPRQTPPPLPMGHLGLWTSFQVEGHCEEAINHARLLMVELHRAVDQPRQTPPSLPMGHLGLWTSFQVEGHCEEAIDWVDGDGGYLVAAHLPGLLEWVGRRAPGIAWTNGMWGQLIPFRCHGHNAVELDHVYHGPGRRWPALLGYWALSAALRAVVGAARVVIYTEGEVDAYGRRLICDVTTTTSTDGVQ